MNLSISTSVRKSLILIAGLSYTLTVCAQSVVGDLQDKLVAPQVARVKTAIQKLAPHQIAGCWLNPSVIPLIGLSELEGKGIQVTSISPEAGSLASKVKPGDALVSIDGEAIKPGDTKSQYLAGKMRSSPFYKLRTSGRSFVEIYRNTEGQEVSVVNPVRLDCSTNDMFIYDGNSDRAATRSSFGLSISSTRLAYLNDEQLLAFLAWNHAFGALRHESNADVWGVLTLLGNGHASNFEYSSSAHEKIDWVTLSILRSMNANLNTYASMLSAVAEFDKAAGFSLLGSKRFVSPDSGGSPSGGEEKQIRLAAWVKLLESDAAPVRPATLKIPNVLLSLPTLTTLTVPPVSVQTVDKALQPLLGETKSKEAAERYMASFDVMQLKPENTTPSHLRGGVKAPVRFHMLFVHHATKRVIWLARSSPSDSDGDLCAKASDCSLLVVGPHVVAVPSPAWAAALTATPDSYVLEELK